MNLMSLFRKNSSAPVARDRLQVVEARSRHLGLDTVARRPAGQRRRRKHRDPIAARVRQRNGDEDIGRPAFDGTNGPKGAAIGQIPVDMHISDHERPGIGLALESDACCLSHGAMGAIAAHHIVKASLFHRVVGMLQLDAHPLIVRIHADEGHTTLDCNAMSREVLGEQPLRFILGDAQLGIGQVEPRVFRILRWVAVNDRAHAGEPQAGIHHLPGDTHILPDFERSRRHADGTAKGRGHGRLVDQAASCSVPHYFGSERKTHRPRTYNQNIRH